jgi:2-Cys peroxiredoxin 5
MLRLASRTRSFATKAAKMAAELKAGAAVPSVLLGEGTPATTVNLAELCGAGKRVVVFGVPGAFTPGCSKTHLPGYVAQSAAIRAKGVDEIVCVAVDNAFVMASWGEAHGAGGKVRMLSDNKGELAKALGVAIELPVLRQGVTNKRFSFIAKDGVITHMNVEPPEAATGMTCSLVDPLLKQL